MSDRNMRESTSVPFCSSASFLTGWGNRINGSVEQDYREADHSLKYRLHPR